MATIEAPGGDQLAGRRTVQGVIKLLALVSFLHCTGFAWSQALAGEGASSVQADLFVSPRGNDAWSGRLAVPSKDDGPVATLERALSLAREKRSSVIPKPFTILVRAGTYEIMAPLLLTARDSGTPEGPLTVAAYPGESPVISAGRRLESWHRGEAKTWIAELPAGAAPRRISSLYVDGARRYRARLPKQGYFQVADALPADPPTKNGGSNRFRFPEGTFQTNWREPTYLEVIAFHNWSVSRLPVERIDAAKREVTLRGQTRGEAYKMAKGARFLIDNVSEALTSPGEFYYDYEKRSVSYIPMLGEDVTRASIVVPWFEHALILSNADDNGQHVAHIHFRGLNFSHTNWVLPEKGSATTQAAIGMPSAILAIGTRDVRFDGVIVRGTGGHGLSFGLGSQGGAVINSLFEDLGAGGILIGDGARSVSAAKWLKASSDSAVGSMRLEGNTLRAGGRLDPAAVGIWVGRATDNRIERNEVSDFYYSGISLGWSWGFGESGTAKNIVSNNTVYTIGQSVLSDMGGIYTLGISPGTIISNNRITDVRAAAYGGYGIYNDEGSSQIVMERNVICDVSDDAYHLNTGKDLIIQHNILALGKHSQASVSTRSPHELILRNNILFSTGAALPYSGEWPSQSSDENLIFGENGPVIRATASLTYQDWQRRFSNDTHSMVIDPGFKNPKRCDLSAAAQAPAKRPPFHSGEIGPRQRTSAEWPARTFRPAYDPVARR